MLSQASQGDIRRFELESQAASEPAPQDPAWWDAVARFKAAAAQMEQSYQRLLALRDYAASRPALSARYRALVSRASTIRSTVADIKAKLESAVDWFRSIGAAVGLNGLGVLPILGIAAIAAAIALITKWTTDAAVFFRAVNEQRRLEAAGVAPERAAEIVRETAAAARGAGLDKWLPLVLLAGVGWFAWSQMQRGRR